MFVCKVALLVTVSQNIHYETLHGLPSIKSPIMEKSIQGIVKSYAVRGFLVKFIFADLQLRQSRIVVILKEQLLILSLKISMSKTLSDLFEF